MAKTSKAPSGFYTASEVMKKLAIANSTLYYYVDIGKIRRVIPPGKKEGYYLKSEVDTIIKAKELFILQYATDTSTFEPAQEEDIVSITSLCVELFGKSGTASYETRLAQYRTNPQIFSVLKQEELVVGYIGLFPLKQETIEQIMSGVEESMFRVGLLAPENITQFKSGEADHVFLTLGVRQGLKRSKAYGARIISGGIENLEYFVRKNVIIKKLYATSRTQDGIRLCKGMGFNQITPRFEEDDLLRFELDLAATQSSLFEKYQKIARKVNEIKP